MKWFEELPEQCPPADAEPANGMYYRIVGGIPSKTEDYFSQRRLQPTKTFHGEGIDECVIRSVSLFDSIDAATKRLLLPKFRTHKVAVVQLEEKDGVVKKTFGPSHYSWWRTEEFDYTKAKLVTDEE